MSLGLEGRLPDEELVAEHAEAPQVHLLVVHLTLDHLRRQVVQRPAQRCASVQIHMIRFITQFSFFVYTHRSRLRQ